MIEIMLWASKHRGWLTPLVGVLALFLAMQGCYQKGRWDERAAYAEKAAAAQARVDAIATRASTAASSERAADAARIDANQSSRKDADDAIPLSTPSLARLAFNCERLRQQGANLAKTPRCERFAAPRQAPAHR